MENRMLQKYSIFEIKLYLAELEKQYGKDMVEELIGKEKSDEINREFRRQIADRLVPYWKEIQDYESGCFWKRLRVQLKYILLDRSGECSVPKHVLQAIVEDMLPDIRAFFESEEGKRSHYRWYLSTQHRRDNRSHTTYTLYEQMGPSPLMKLKD